MDEIIKHDRELAITAKKILLLSSFAGAIPVELLDIILAKFLHIDVNSITFNADVKSKMEIQSTDTDFVTTEFDLFTYISTNVKITSTIKLSPFNANFKSYSAMRLYRFIHDLDKLRRVKIRNNVSVETYICESAGAYGFIEVKFPTTVYDFIANFIDTDLWWDCSRVLGISLSNSEKFEMTIIKKMPDDNLRSMVITKYRW